MNLNRKFLLFATLLWDISRKNYPLFFSGVGQVPGHVMSVAEVATPLSKDNLDHFLKKPIMHEIQRWTFSKN